MVWGSRIGLASLQWDLSALCPPDVDPVYRPLHYAAALPLAWPLVAW